jgi:hypothetical protein
MKIYADFIQKRIYLDNTSEPQLRKLNSNNVEKDFSLVLNKP